jgi:predicted nucleotide-binding protein
MFYHARLTLKPEGKRSNPEDAVELDLSHEDLLAKIVVPYFEGRTFFCGGKVVDPKRVQDLHFNETTQPSKDLFPFIRAERRNSNVITFTSDEWYVTAKGTDITRKVLDEARSMVRSLAVRQNGNTLQINNRIFVVHGHDIAAVDQVELLLRRWGLEPIILRDRPNKGLTVIEKIEANTEVGYGIVLLTPDDLGGVSKDTLAQRARQNVIFEWGYLMAKLGRERVACLYNKGVELPSDLHGIVRIEIGDDIRDSAEEIRRELVSAGYHLRTS